jgi:Holliday junction resolvase
MARRPMKTWEKYEEVTKQLLTDIRDFLGLTRIEGKQKVKGQKSGTEWQIDVVAYDATDEKLILVECKQRLKSKLPQESLGGLAYRIEDTGAGGGIIVTTIGLQEGAQKVAKAEKITEIKLDPDSTGDNYIAQITNQIFAKRTENIGLDVSIDAELNPQNH